MTICCPDINIFVLSDSLKLDDIIKNSKLKSFINFSYFNKESKKSVAKLFNNDIDFVVLDLDCYNKYIAEYPALERCFLHPFLVISNNSEPAQIVDYMKRGATDYIIKSKQESYLLEAILKVLENFSSSLCAAGEYTKKEAFSHIITRNTQMTKIFSYAEAVAKTDISVLITGDTGTGKEEMAKAIHTASGRKGDFVAVNVSGLDDKLFADTLFGHVKGAFTGASQGRVGLIKKASRGTLFLDEIGDLKIEGQLKLLRLLQEKEYYPLGSDEFSSTDARVVLATNCDLAALVKQGVFRKDLYFRLKAHEIKLPSLAERKGDIPYLIGYFINKACSILGQRKGLFVPDEIYTILNNYSFPGNIRELELMITDSVVVSRGNVLTLEVIKDRIFKSAGISKTELKRTDLEENFRNINFLPSVKYVNLLLIKEALQRTDNNKTQAAGLIGITRQTIDRYLKEV